MRCSYYSPLTIKTMKAFILGVERNVVVVSTNDTQFKVRVSPTKISREALKSGDFYYDQLNRVVSKEVYTIPRPAKKSLRRPFR